MTTTLSEGVKVPDVGSTDWADDLETNWNLLNTALAQQGSWAKVDEAQTFTGVQTFSDGIVGSLQGTANMAMSDADGNTITSTYATKTELSTLSSTVGTKANDADVVHKADAETITGAKTFSATVTSADVVPSATDTYSLGSASYQYNAVYGKSYFYNGTQWGLDVANTWTTSNTFTGHASPIRLRGSDDDIYNVQPQSAASSQITFVDKNNFPMSYIAFQHRADETETHRLCLRQMRITDNNYYSINLNNLGNFYPEQSREINLGTYWHRFKTLNGVNPGALSLPSTSYTDISSYITNLNGGANTYTAPSDGYISCLVDGATSLYMYINGGINTSYTRPTSGAIRAFMPVLSGQTVYIGIFATTVTNFRFFPCQGNV